MNTNPHTIQRVTITAAIAVFAFTTAACGTESVPAETGAGIERPINVPDRSGSPGGHPAIPADEAGGQASEPQTHGSQKFPDIRP